MTERCPCHAVTEAQSLPFDVGGAPAAECPRCKRTLTALELARVVATLPSVTGLTFNDPPRKPAGVCGADYIVRVTPTGAAYDVTVAAESIDRHLEITGELPKVGEPLYAAPAGLPSWACHVPVGVVTHVEKRAPQSN